MFLKLSNELEDVNNRLSTNVDVDDLIRRADLTYFDANNMENLSSVLFGILTLTNFTILSALLLNSPNSFNAGTLLIEILHVSILGGISVIWKMYWAARKEYCLKFKELILKHQDVQAIINPDIQKLSFNVKLRQKSYFPQEVQNEVTIADGD